MKILSDEKLNDIEADVWYDTTLTDGDRNHPTKMKLLIRDRQIVTQHKDTLRQVRELLDGLPPQY
ncbi:hypothetical protein LCGC14_2003230, partial [marine sediment metagenome]